MESLNEVMFDLKNLEKNIANCSKDAEKSLSIMNVNCILMCCTKGADSKTPCFIGSPGCK